MGGLTICIDVHPFYRVLEHLQILVSAWVPEPLPHGTDRVKS